jgi:hypothetical protein
MLQIVSEIWCTYLDRAANCFSKMMLSYKINKMVFLKNSVKVVIENMDFLLK